VQISAIERATAFSVHLLTTSGALWAFLALIAAAEHRFVMMFWWLGVALFVDGIDGPLARKFEVKKRLPHWSGELLDCIIDYVTYVLIPAFALYKSDLIAEPYGFIAAAIIILSATIYYADMRMKTTNNSFRGFPVCWNMAVFSLFVISPSSLIAFAIVVLCTICTFIPVYFVHPVRVVKWRLFTLGIFALWSFFGIMALFQGLTPDYWVIVGATVTSIYLFMIGGIIQFLEK
jgi:phosphatidylcholine synthase